MKKAILALSMYLTIGLTTALADKEKKVDPRVLSAFQKDFSLAENVKWEIKDGLSKARFSIFDQSLVAWYNAEAELVTTIRNISYKQLPLSVIKSLEEKYGEADFTNMQEVTKDQETNYFIQVETKVKKLIIKSNFAGNLSVFKKIKT